MRIRFIPGIEVLAYRSEALASIRLGFCTAWSSGGTSVSKQLGMSPADLFEACNAFLDEVGYTGRKKVTKTKPYFQL
jgi:hypothetical protein